MLSNGARQVIYLQPQAPAKPRVGAACNGCGVCCASEPCPLGVLASRRWRGPCAALRWHAGQGRYLCGLVARPWPAVPRRLQPLAQRLMRRWIAAGDGCDAAVDVAPG